MADSTPEVGTRVVHRRYVPYSHAHYAGNLVDGAYSLGLFGDVATEMCIVTDGDEGLFASYSDVQFRAPVRAGDVLEVTCELVKAGTRSRVLDFTVTVVARGAATAEQPGAAEVLDPPAARHHRDRHRRGAAATLTGLASKLASPLAAPASPLLRRVDACSLGLAIVHRRVCRCPTRRPSWQILSELPHPGWRLTCGFARSRRSAPG